MQQQPSTSHQPSGSASSQDTIEYDQEVMIRLFTGNGPLIGKWGPIRLFREAHLENRSECIRWCMNVGLISSKTPYCHRYKVDYVLKHRESQDYSYWKCNKCGDEKPVTHGTIFEDANNIGQVLLLALAFAKGSTYEEAKNMCIMDRKSPTVSNHTICRWYDRFREAISAKYPELVAGGTGRIGGPGVNVQIDEAYFGRRKYNRGRWLEGRWVFGMSSENNETRMELVERRDAKTLTEIILRCVRPGSIINSDEWPAYRGLEQLGYTHRTVCHKREFVATDGTHTNRMESGWRDFRRKNSLGGQPLDKLADHLVEYLWRKHCTRQGSDAFASLIVALLV